MLISTTQHKRTITAWMLTLTIHALILLALLWWRYQLPVPVVKEEELGMEVNLGVDENGFGDQQTLASDAPADQQDLSTASPNNSVNFPTTDQDAPAISIAKVPINQRLSANVTQRNAASNLVKPKYILSGALGKGGNNAMGDESGASEGNTQGAGDRGVAGGVSGSKNYTGSPGQGAGGVKPELEGRAIIAFPAPEAFFREGGKVVFRITVNRDGIITNKQIVSCDNPELRTIALQKIARVRFNKSADAPVEQFGKITFAFTLRE
jgi:outer membrane biosynthesis protein TonB